MIEQASLVIGNGNWAVKSDSLLGYKINGGKYYPREMSVVRATTGTRINEDGLVELVPYNLLRYSEEFDNADWGKTRADVTSNTTTAPNQTLTADTITANATGAGTVVSFFGGGVVSVTSGVRYTISVYAKKGNQDWLIFNIANSAATTYTRQWFNISTGVIGSTNTFGGGLSAQNATIISVGDGWYRCSFDVLTNDTGLRGGYVLTNADATFSATLGDTIFLWGAQVVEGTEPLDYLPTTDRLDVARIDYSTGEPALLLEPQRTNLALYSEQFDNAAWTKANCTVTSNQTESPSNYVDADLVTTTSTSHALFAAAAVTASTAYTFSFYVKRGTMTDLAYRVFNLTAGTDIVTPTSYYSQTTASGWSRITLSFTTPLGCTSARVYPISNSGVTGTAYLWGAQLELGSYATSYIPTLAAVVTRGADVCSKTGISSLIGQTEGTMFVECSALADDATNRRITISDGTANNRIYISYKNYTNQLRIEVISAGSSVFDSTYTIADITQTAKIAVAYKLNDFAFYVNGVQVAVDTSGAVPTSMSVFKFEDGAGGNVFFGKVNQAILFPTRLTNAELATLTTI